MPKVDYFNSKQLQCGSLLHCRASEFLTEVLILINPGNGDSFVSSSSMANSSWKLSENRGPWHCSFMEGVLSGRAGTGVPTSQKWTSQHAGFGCSPSSNADGDH